MSIYQITTETNNCVISPILTSLTSLANFFIELIVGSITAGSARQAIAP